MRSLTENRFVKNAYWTLLNARTRFRIRRLLHGGNSIRLDIGSGSKRGCNGWTTVDRGRVCDVSWDLRRGIPFPGDSVQQIYMSHFLEHLSFREMQRFLLECLRVLKSGAVISVAVPDAHLYVSAYLNAASVGPPPTTYEAAWHGTTAIDFLNYIGYMDGHHKHMFDADHLVHVLAAAGFRDVRLRPFDASLDLEERRLESVYAEALK